MTINGIDTIKDDGWDYLVLADYYSEGIAVVEQYANLEAALEAMADQDGPLALVRLVRFDVTEPPDKRDYRWAFKRPTDDPPETP